MISGFISAKNWVNYGTASIEVAVFVKKLIKIYFKKSSEFKNRQ